MSPNGRRSKAFRAFGSVPGTRGRPRKLRLSPKRIIRYIRTPELVSALQDIQRLRTILREQALPAEREAQLWDDLTTAAIYHTNRLEGNQLAFDEAKVVIEEYRQWKRANSSNGWPLGCRCRGPDRLDHFAGSNATRGNDRDQTD